MFCMLLVIALLFIFYFCIHLLMADKFKAIFYAFAGTVLVLFGIFSFLMTTVNPPRLRGASAAPPTTTTETVSIEPTEPPDNLMKFMGFSTKPRNQMSIKDKILSKGRRSINDPQMKKDTGVVIMKVVDDEGRPRVEVVLYPKWSNSNWRIYKINNVVDPQHRESNLLQNSRFLPEDTISIGSDLLSSKWDIESNFRTNDDTSDNNKTTEAVLDKKSDGTNTLKKTNYSQAVETTDSNLRLTEETTIPSWDSSLTIRTRIKINENDEEQPIKDLIKKNTDDLFHSIISEDKGTGANIMTHTSIVSASKLPLIEKHNIETFSIVANSSNVNIETDTTTVTDTIEIPSGTLISSDDSKSTFDIEEKPTETFIFSEVSVKKSLVDLISNQVSGSKDEEESQTISIENMNTETDITTLTGIEVEPTELFVVPENSEHTSVTVGNLSHTAIDLVSHSSTTIASAGEDKDEIINISNSDTETDVTTITGIEVKLTESSIVSEDSENTPVTENNPQ